MINSTGRRALTCTLALAIAAGAVMPLAAAPISGGASLVSALPKQTTDVRWRRGGAWVGAGIATGLVLGGIAASRAYSAPRYYGPDYYEPAPAYGPGYAYGPQPTYVDEDEPVYAAPAPVYAAPARGYREPAPANGIRQCYVVTNADHNLGYWRPC